MILQQRYLEIKTEEATHFHLFLLLQEVWLLKEILENVQLFHHGEARIIQKQNTLKVNKPNREHLLPTVQKYLKPRKYLKLFIYYCIKIYYGISNTAVQEWHTQMLQMR